MAILQVRDIDDHLYAALKSVAKVDKRSMSQEVISIIEKYLADPSHFDTNPTREFLSLGGSWADDRTAGEIVADIRKQRKNSRQLGTDDALFD